MTDSTANSTDNFTAWDAMMRERDRLVAELRPANKNMVFDVLAAAAITHVVVSFDGCGDSGQIEQIDAFAGDTTTVLPSGQIEFAEPADAGAICRRVCSVVEGIEKLAYDALAETHSGWENNEGAYGEFTFNVAARSISLDFEERYTTSQSHQHNF